MLEVFGVWPGVVPIRAVCFAHVPTIQDNRFRTSSIRNLLIGLRVQADLDVYCLERGNPPLIGWTNVTPKFLSNVING